ncbi:MAG: histidinol dehydrogenase, partial [Spirochaetota bacterium]
MNIRFYEWAKLSEAERAEILARSEQDIASVQDAVGEIVSGVRADGDAALREYTRRFDKVDLAQRPIAVSKEEFEAAEAEISFELRKAVEYAVDNVWQVHKEQL